MTDRVLTTAGDTDWWRPQTEERTVPAPDAGTVPAPAAERNGRMAFGALVVYSVILVAAPQEFITVLGPLRIALAVGVVAIVAHAIDRVSGRVRLRGWPIEVRLAAFLLAWAIVTLPFSYWPGGSVQVLMNLYLKSLAVFVLLASVLDTTRRIRMVMAVFVGCSTLIALTAIEHFLTGQTSSGSGNRILGYGTSSLAGNPNDLALVLNIAIPINAALVLSARSPIRRLIGLATLVLGVAGIVATFSRAGFLAVSLTGCLFLWRLARRGAVLPAAAIAAGALVLVFLMPAGYADRLSTVSDIDSDQTGSAQGRWRDTVLAAGFVVRHPFVGAGVGMDYLALNELRGPKWVSVHNIYLNYAVDLGVLGLLVFLAMYWSALWGVARVERARSKIGRDELGLLATGIRIGLCSFAVAGFFHPIAYHAFFYYLAGLAVAIRRVDQQEGAAS